MTPPSSSRSRGPAVALSQLLTRPRGRSQRAERGIPRHPSRRRRLAAVLLGAGRAAEVWLPRWEGESSYAHCRAFNDDRDFREGRQELLVMDLEHARVEARSAFDDEHVIQVQSTGATGQMSCSSI
eukprot:756697-Hanusia_phi.AAC.6